MTVINLGKLLNICICSFTDHVHWIQPCNSALPYDITPIGDIHGISDRATSNCIHSVFNAICDNMQKFISWPVEEEAAKILSNHWRVSTCCEVGIIDGTQIPIYAPPQLMKLRL